jgi:transposase
MGAAYTMDLRERVVETFRSGRSREETATLFRVSQSSVQRWSRLDREKGSVAALKMGGHRPFALASERDGIIKRIAQQPDLPLRTLRAELQGRGINVSYFAVWNIVDRAGLSFKKKPCTPANRIVRTSRAGVCSGSSARIKSTLGALFSLTKPGRRRT